MFCIDSFIQFLHFEDTFQAVDSAWSAFLFVIEKALDQVIPKRTKWFTSHNCPYFDDELKFQKRQKRKCERAFRKTKSSDSLLSFTLATDEYYRLLLVKKGEYISSTISSTCKKLKSKALASLLGENHRCLPKTHGSAKELANCFNSFFLAKVKKLVESIPTSDFPTYFLSPTSQLDSFMTISSETLLHYVNQVSNSSCPKEPMPRFKTASLHFCDSLLSLINMTVRSARFPEILKIGFVVPLIKKPSLDPENLNNYRPVTNLLFLSKVLELVLFEQLKTYLEVNSFYGKFQSAYCRRHSTETALTRISNDLLGYLDSGFSPLYVGLDLSAAFDSIDHHLLLRVLEMRLGVRSDALKMLES